MKLIHDSTPCVLHLLLLAELFVHSSSHPAHSPSLCARFGAMTHQVDRLTNLSRKLHSLSDTELQNFAAMENKLHSLPHMHHTAAHFTSLKVNESLSQLYVYIQSFKQHVDWLKTTQNNFSLPSHSAEGTSTHLLQLSNLINSSLHQMSEDVPESPSPSLPDVSTAFEVLQVSVEISERLKSFCDWTKRLLRPLQKLSGCPRH